MEFTAQMSLGMRLRVHYNEVEVGSLGSQRVTEMRLDKVTGHIYISTSNASTRPRYCRRRTRRRGSRFSYYFCGYVYDYNGGLLRTNKAVLSS